MDKDVRDPLKEILEHLKTTSEDSWCVEVCANKDLTKWCLKYHLNAMSKEGRIDYLYFFEECIATQRMYYPVNDGENPKYQQPTPKQRCIAYIEAIIDWSERSLQDEFEVQEKHGKEIEISIASTL